MIFTSYLTAQFIHSFWALAFSSKWLIAWSNLDFDIELGKEICYGLYVDTKKGKLLRLEVERYLFSNARSPLWLRDEGILIEEASNGTDIWYIYKCPGSEAEMLFVLLLGSFGLLTQVKPMIFNSDMESQGGWIKASIQIWRLRRTSFIYAYTTNHCIKPYKMEYQCTRYAFIRG